MAIPEEPKKPQNAYWIFLSENREALTKEAGSNSGPAVGKVAGAKWKGMSEAAKAPYEKKAEAAKAKFEKDLAAFVAAGGVAGKRRADKAEAKREKEGKRRRTTDPNKPKRPASAYWLWLGENREALAAEVSKKGAKMDVTAVSKAGGAKWQALSSKAKEPFEKRAAELKKKYEKEMEEYKKNNANADDDEEDDVGDEEEA